LQAILKSTTGTVERTEAVDPIYDALNEDFQYVEADEESPESTQ